MEKIVHEGVGKRLLQHKTKPGSVFGSRPRQSAIFFFILHKCGSILKCFLVIFVRSVHFVDSNRIGFQPSDNR